jgi:hypothetical protein
VSLVELLLSVGLLAAVFYVVVSLFPTALLSLKRSHDSFAAGQIAQRYLEQMRASRFDLAVPSTTTTETVGGTTFVVERQACFDTDSGGGGSASPTAYASNVKDLEVTVSWNGGSSAGVAPVVLSKTYTTSVFRPLNP